MGLQAPKPLSSKALKLQTLKLQSSQAPKLSSSKAPKLSSSKALKLQSSQAPKLSSSPALDPLSLMELESFGAWELEGFGAWELWSLRALEFESFEAWELEGFGAWELWSLRALELESFGAWGLWSLRALELEGFGAWELWSSTPNLYIFIYWKISVCTTILKFLPSSLNINGFRNDNWWALMQFFLWEFCKFDFKSIHCSIKIMQSYGARFWQKYAKKITINPRSFFSDYQHGIRSKYHEFSWKKVYVNKQNTH